MAITKKLTSGLIEESSERLLVKRSYYPPSVKTVDFVVEAGFGGSGDGDVTREVPLGNRFFVETTHRLSQTESSDYQWSTADEGWF